MTKNEQQQIYVSPQVETTEIKVQAIICQSGGIDSMLRDQEDGGNAFN